MTLFDYIMIGYIANKFGRLWKEQEFTGQVFVVHYSKGSEAVYIA